VKRERLFDVTSKERWTGSRALVPLPDDACPECGGDVDSETVDQRPLLRHGGYGAAKRTTMRHCRCGWRMESERSEVKP
jgi:hypothetical protein